MYCGKCGKRISDKALFCTYCGTSVEAYSVLEEPSTNAEPTAAAPIESAPAVNSAPAELSAEQAPEIDLTRAISASVADEEQVVGAEEFVAPTAEGAAPIVGAVEPIAPTEAPLAPTELDAPVSSEAQAPALPIEGRDHAPQNSGGFEQGHIPEGAALTSSSHHTTDSPEAHNAPRKLYTFGHIMMCVAAVAVMAITAGVFAGLYFSVV